MPHYHIIVRGDVQGVGFRYFTRGNASLFGIRGWVRNKSDGSVEIEAEGNDTGMSEFIKAVERGNRFSYIDSVDAEKIQKTAGFSSFDIVDDD